MSLAWFQARQILTLDLPRIISRAQHTHTGFAYAGNPFATKITMKRHVPDLSIPDYEKQECLKWSDWKMLRDVKRRHINSEYWQYRLNLRNLERCITLPSAVRDLAKEERNQTPRPSSVKYVRNRCAVSSRGRGKFIRYRLSRIVWRDMSDHGLLSGVIRAKWG